MFVAAGSKNGLHVFPMPARSMNTAKQTALLLSLASTPTIWNTSNTKMTKDGVPVCKLGLRMHHDGVKKAKHREKYQCPLAN